MAWIIIPGTPDPISITVTSWLIGAVRVSNELAHAFPVFNAAVVILLLNVSVKVSELFVWSRSPLASTLFTCTISPMVRFKEVKFTFWVAEAGPSPKIWVVVVNTVELQEPPPSSTSRIPSLSSSISIEFGIPSKSVSISEPVWSWSL